MSSFRRRLMGSKKHADDEFEFLGLYDMSFITSVASPSKQTQWLDINTGSGDSDGYGIHIVTGTQEANVRFYKEGEFDLNYTVPPESDMYVIARVWDLAASPENVYMHITGKPISFGTVEYSSKSDGSTYTVLLNGLKEVLIGKFDTIIEDSGIYLRQHNCITANLPFPKNIKRLQDGLHFDTDNSNIVAISSTRVYEHGVINLHNLENIVGLTELLATPISGLPNITEIRIPNFKGDEVLDAQKTSLYHKLHLPNLKRINSTIDGIANFNDLDALDTNLFLSTPLITRVNLQSIKEIGISVNDTGELSNFGINSNIAGFFDLPATLTKIIFYSRSNGNTIRLNSPFVVSRVNHTSSKFKPARILVPNALLNDYLNDPQWADYTDILEGF